MDKIIDNFDVIIKLINDFEKTAILYQYDENNKNNKKNYHKSLLNIIKYSKLLEDSARNEIKNINYGN